MEKVLVPSVTLIVGCGVSSLTLLLLIIIYVSVWRYGFHSLLLFLLGKVTVS